MVANSSHSPYPSRGYPRASLFPKFKMEESDEDVDVEDISDGEQISHLRYGTGGDQKNSWYVYIYVGLMVMKFICRKIGILKSSE